MPTSAQQTERVLSILRDLPSSKVNEVIDFAEYLKAKTRKTKPLKQSTTDLPLYHMGAVEPEDAAQKHDSWVRGIVEAALTVANDPETEFIPHEAVKARWVEKKKTLLERTAKGHLP